MNIKIKKIKVNNFAGVANGEYNFEDGANIIYGKSGSGKSTAYLAYLWALGFTVPTWEPQIDSYRISKLKTTVEVFIEVDGIQHIISKTNTPKYKLNKFTGEEEYYSSDFKYILDSQEASSYAEYKEKISNLYGIDYFTLELLSNTSLFNGEDARRWNKEERRKFLFKLFDLDNKISQLGQDSRFESIKEYLIQGKDEIEINQILNTQKTDIDHELKNSQIIIEERQKELSDYSYIDFDDLKLKKESVDKEIISLSQQHKEEAKNTLFANKKEELAALVAKLNFAKSNNDKLCADWDRKKSEYESKLWKADFDIGATKSYIEHFTEEIQDKNRKLEILSSAEIDDDVTICSFCKQKLPDDIIKENIGAWQQKKNNDISLMENDISKLAQQVIDFKEKLRLLEEEKAAAIGYLEELNENPPKTADTKDIETEISKLEQEISCLNDKNIYAEIEDRIKALQDESDRIMTELSKKAILDRIRDRIEELKTRVRELGELDSIRIEKKNALRLYTQEKVKLVNDNVNKYFDGVRYNFFKWNSGANAAKEYMDVCNAVLAETGVEYDSLSSGQKVKVNTFTNNSLRKILGVNIPQFIDDCVLSDMDMCGNNWQTIYLVTDNAKDIDLTLITDCYSINDCDVKYKK